MFWTCSKLRFKGLPEIEKWDTRNAKDVDEVFDGFEYGKNKHIGDFIANKFIKFATGKF